MGEWVRLLDVEKTIKRPGSGVRAYGKRWRDLVFAITTVEGDYWCASYRNPFTGMPVLMGDCRDDSCLRGVPFFRSQTEAEFAVQSFINERVAKRGNN